jgi:C-22 sterol desaturase
MHRLAALFTFDPRMSSIISPRHEAAISNASSTLKEDISNGNGLLSSYLNGYSKSQILLTILVVLIVYDQCMYLWRKGPIAGPAFKIPFMGPFIRALYPKFDHYLAQWASGPLSCVSVFHK